MTSENEIPADGIQNVNGQIHNVQGDLSEAFREGTMLSIVMASGKVHSSVLAIGMIQYACENEEAYSILMIQYSAESNPISLIFRNIESYEVITPAPPKPKKDDEPEDDEPEDDEPDTDGNDED